MTTKRVPTMLEVRDPKTSPPRLRDLSQDACEIVRRWVACHPNTPCDVLEALLEDEDYFVPWNLAQNPSAPPELLQEIVTRRLFLDQVAGNRSAPAALLAQLALERDEWVRAAAALNPATPPSALKLLSGDKEQRVRWSVARNTATSPELLEALASDPDEKVWRAVARNRNTPRPLKLILKRSLGM